MKYTTPLLSLLAFFLFLPGAVFANSIMEQSDAGTVQNAPFTANYSKQPLGGGFSGYPVTLKYIDKTSASSSLVILECNTASSTFDGSSNGCEVGQQNTFYQVNGQDNVTTDTLGGGFYKHTFSTSTPYFSFDPTKFYIIYSGTSGGETMGSLQQYFPERCITSASGFCDTIASTYVYIETTGSVPILDITPTTRIVSFTPENGTTTNPAATTFFYHAYILPTDTSPFYHYRYEFTYQHQVAGKTLQELLVEDATTTGDFVYSTTTALETGNYIVNAGLKKLYLGIFTNPFADNVEYQYHQFVVGSSTYLGDVFQNTIAQTDANLNNRLATSTIVKLSHCNPLGGSFDIIDCLIGVVVPSTTDMSNLITSFRTTFLAKAPWGYATIAVTDITTSLATTTLPQLSYVFASTSPIAGASLNFTPWDKMLGPTSYLGANHADFVNAATNWFNTIWLLGFAFVLIKEFFGHSGGFSHDSGKNVEYPFGKT